MKRNDAGPTGEQQARIELVTSGLLKLAERFTRGTFTDIYAWTETGGSSSPWSRLNIAFVGNPVKVSALFGMLGDEGISNLRADWVSHAVRQALGVKESGFEYEHDISLGDFLDRLGGQTLYDVPGADAFTENSCVFIPEPGYPWAEDDKPIAYWSAKKRKWITPKRPAWLVEIALDQNTKQQLSRHSDRALGVNPCVVFPPDETKTAPGGHVYGEVTQGSYRGTSIMVAHSMSLPEAEVDSDRRFHKTIDTAIANINARGGLLFPSLSVGPIPASNFGPVSLIAHLELVLAALKPYKKRNRNPAWVYDTDSWTVGTSELMTVIAAQLFSELHGHEDWSHGRHMWVLGPPSEFHGGPRGDQTPISSMGPLLKGIRQRMKRFEPDMDEVDYLRLEEELAGTDEKYAYCEAKTREVVRLDEFPLLIAPDSYADRVERFVKGVKYKGDVVLLPDEEQEVLTAEETGNGYLMYLWAWRVAEAVKAYQVKRNRQVVPLLT